MKTIVRMRYGRDEIIHYYRPGIHLTDSQLLELNKILLSINRSGKSSIVHPFLEPGLPLPTIRTIFSQMVVSVASVKEEAAGFQLSPLFDKDGIRIVHGGLIVIVKNLGSDLISLLTAGTFSIAYMNEGKIFSTNITSTPVGMEAFSKFVSRVWPIPDTALIRPPEKYKSVAQILFSEYIKKNFLEPESLQIDYKRFVLGSSSQKMGFVTDFHKISRSLCFKYMNFCHVWMNYDKQEDLIQVGLIDWKSALRMLAFCGKHKLATIGYKRENRVRSQAPSMA